MVFLMSTMCLINSHAFCAECLPNGTLKETQKIKSLGRCLDLKIAKRVDPSSQGTIHQPGRRRAFITGISCVTASTVGNGQVTHPEGSRPRGFPCGGILWKYL